ncbi:MAG: hypothetical protein HC905_01470 [Bacteroidales bacterium]|nr:hypothetical protein [Bacteroidales bacterium]
MLEHHQRIKNWEEIRHYGRKGNDDGIDIWPLMKIQKSGIFNAKDIQVLALLIF